MEHTRVGAKQSKPNDDKESCIGAVDGSKRDGEGWRAWGTASMVYLPPATLLGLGEKWEWHVREGVGLRIGKCSEDRREER